MIKATKKAAPKFSPVQAKVLFERAYEAGQVAGNAKNPVPMNVVERENLLDDSSPIVRQYEPAMAGVCGFAWVTVRPGNSSFARWLAKNTHSRSGYHGGVQYWVREFNQSYERKMAFADAFAAVLEEAGIEAYSEGRLD